VDNIAESKSTISTPGETLDRESSYFVSYLSNKIEAPSGQLMALVATLGNFTTIMLF